MGGELPGEPVGLLAMDGVAGAVDDDQARRPGMAAATDSARGRPVWSRAPAITVVGTAIRGEVARASAAMTPWPAPRRLAARPCGSLRRRPARISVARSPREGARSVANSGSASQRSVNAAMPSVSSSCARRSSAARRSPRAAASAMPADGLSSTRLRTTSGVVERQPQRHARPEAVADDVGRGERLRAQERGEVGRLPLHRVARRVARRVRGAVAQEVHRDGLGQPLQGRPERLPVGAAAREPVEQQHRRPERRSARTA